MPVGLSETSDGEDEEASHAIYNRQLRFMYFVIPYFSINRANVIFDDL